MTQKVFSFRRCRAGQATKADGHKKVFSVPMPVPKQFAPVRGNPKHRLNLMRLLWQAALSLAGFVPIPYNLVY